MGRNLEIQVTPEQDRFLRSRALYRGFVGGRRAGKTYVGSLDILLRALQVPGLYAVYAPTYPMLRDTSLRALLEWGRKLSCLKDVNYSDIRLVLWNGAEIICRSLEDPEKARGLGLMGVWLDEASLIKKYAIHIVSASLGTRMGQGWLSATFTPKGKKHWTYEIFGEGGENIELIHARTIDNPFIPRDFVEILRRQYPKYYVRQELDGIFIDPPGSVFKREWFKIVDSYPSGLTWYRYWDLAASTRTSADYTASVALAMAPDGSVFIRDVIRGKWEWPDQERILIQTLRMEPDTQHGIEKALHGLAAVQSLLRRPEVSGVSFRGVQVERDKLSRALALAARAEQGKVFLVRGSWVADFLDELTSFTGDGTTHDDQVDAASGALLMLMESPVPEFAPSIWG